MSRRRKSTKIENFSGMAVELKFNDISEKYALECVDKLKNVQWKKKKSMRPYNDGWTVIQKGNGVIVWNATKWQLTWLLENGHEIVNKKGGSGWASAYPHIDPIFQSVKGAYIHDVEHNTKIIVK